MNLEAEIKAFSISDFLQSHLEERTQRNARYSLRAFARDLKVSPSHLSEIMNGVATPSRESVRKFCEALGFSRDLTEQTCDRFDVTHSKIDWRRDSAWARLRESESNAAVYLYKDDETRYISAIIHLTILSYLELSNPPKTPRDIAERLGESEQSVVAALSRLERIGAVRYADDGSLEVTRTRTRISDGVAPDAIMAFHSQLADFILAGLRRQPRSTRHSDGIIYAISKDAVEEFKAILTDTRKRLTEVSQKHAQKDAVYYVNLQMVEAVKTWR